MSEKEKNKLNRRKFIQVSAVTGLGLTLNLYSCTKKEDPVPKVDENDKTNGIKLSGVSIPRYIDIKKEGTLTISGSGFDANDKIIFKSLTNPDKEFSIAIKSLTETSITVLLPTALLSDEYGITAKRGQSIASMGTTSLDIVFDDNIQDKVGTTIKGVVYSAGVGIANVVVSDGFEVTKTDSMGVYYLSSIKKNGYVFVSIPGNYEVAKDGSLPVFFNKLRRPTMQVEVKDFELTLVNNEKHVVLALGDMHLANRNDDIEQFQNIFLKDLNKTIQAYQSAGTKVYALTLGDMTWETYWLSNNYALPEYRTQINDIKTTVFHTIGNHDNNPYVVGDWASADKFRDVLGPNYYSFNLGKVHYIVLDNVEYTNSGATATKMGNRQFNETIPEDQMDWLRKDLAMIEDKSTPIVVAMHIPLNQSPRISGGTEDPANHALTNAVDFINTVSGFSKVHVLSGHIHVNYNVENSPTLMEHNTAAVCATWWWTGRKGQGGNQIGKDGTPGGFGVWEMEGKDIKWHYKSTDYDRNYQFRAYDLNEVYVTKEKFAPNYIGNEWERYIKGYENKRVDNVVMINVWNYDVKWKVEVMENGQPLAVTRVRAYDPLHIVSYTAGRLNVNEEPATSFVSSLTAHMFRVQASSPISTLEIKVTDRFGNVFTETMVRPKGFSYLMK